MHFNNPHILGAFLSNDEGNVAIEDDKHSATTLNKRHSMKSMNCMKNQRNLINLRY